MADISLNESDEVTIASSDGVNKLIVNSDGSINTVSSLSIPSSGTSVTRNEFGSVSSVTGVDTYYTITNGKVLTLQRFTGGAEPHQSGSVIELFYDPNGDLSSLTRIETIFVNGSSGQVSIYQSFIGNGTRRIVLRRRVYASSAREVWGRWEGFEL
jgi:hypothetical protein